MAELNVEPKKSSPWIWIVIIIIVIIIILYFVFRNNDNKTDNMNNGRDTTTSQIIPAQNQRYLGNNWQTQFVAITSAERNQESHQS